MPWPSAPATAIAGSVLAASFWNLEVRDRMVYLMAQVDPLQSDVATLESDVATIEAQVNSMSTVLSVQQLQANHAASAVEDLALATPLTNFENATVTFIGTILTSDPSAMEFKLIDNNTLRIGKGGTAWSMYGTFYITEYDIPT